MPADVLKQREPTLSGSYTLERELAGGGMSRAFVARKRVARLKDVER